jgi:cobalt-zinc-cadmium resistance protein CzcA
VPLRQVASFGFSEGLNEISRDNGKRRIFVQADVRNRDIGSFVDEAQAAIARDVRIPPGSWLEWGGQFKNLQQAIRRLQFVVPLCMVLIFAALYSAVGSVPLALTVFTAVPLAMAGGVFAIALRGLPFSVSAAVGFIAVSGVAVLNGLVLMASIRRRLEAGEDIPGAIFNGALERVRPVLMTALVASLGFVPMAIATGRRRGSKTARHRRHRRPDHVDGAYAVLAARRVRTVVTPRENGARRPRRGRSRSSLAGCRIAFITLGREKHTP